MAFKIAIDNKVRVNVKGSFKGAAKGDKKEYDFDLVMKRLDQDEINERINGGGTIPDFVHELTEGWDRQRIVLNDDDTPAAFSTEALAALLKQPGMGPAVYQAYLAQVGAQAKN